MRLSRPSLPSSLVLAAGVVFASVLFVPSLRAAAASVIPDLLTFPNASGQGQTFNPRGILDPDTPFFQSMGTNGRSCVTCHAAEDGWTITPASVRQRFDASDGLDPLFRTNDGSNCAGADASTREARETNFSMLLNRGLIRVELPVPAGAEFYIESADDPFNCNAALTSASLYRRPLPATNLRFLTAVMWDGRESPGNISLADALLSQARNATLGHAEAAIAPLKATCRRLSSSRSACTPPSQVISRPGGWGRNRRTAGRSRCLGSRSSSASTIRSARTRRARRSTRMRSRCSTRGRRLRARRTMRGRPRDGR